MAATGIFATSLQHGSLPVTKGKVGNGFGYVNGNALAGREFAD